MAVSSKLTNYLVKAVGVGGLTLVGYESHSYGKLQATNFATNVKADTLTKQLIENTKLDTPSTIRNSLKKQIFNFHMEEGFSDFFTTTAGYIKGFGTMLVSNVVPLGLSAATIMTKGFVSKMFGAGLLAYGGIYLLQEIFGIGKSGK